MHLSEDVPPERIGGHEFPDMAQLITKRNADLVLGTLGTGHVSMRYSAIGTLGTGHV